MSKVLTAEDLVIGNKYVPVSKYVGVVVNPLPKVVIFKGFDLGGVAYFGDVGNAYVRTMTFLPSDVVEYVEPDEESVTDMTVQEFYSGFNLSFLTEEERQTIYTATELFAKGKVRVALTSAPPSASGMRNTLEKLKNEMKECSPKALDRDIAKEWIAEIDKVLTDNPKPTNL